MPRKPLFTILMLALVTGYALPATAALMTIGNLNYDAAVGSNITDTRSGVEYLNLGAVKSLNYAETPVGDGIWRPILDLPYRVTNRSLRFFNALNSSTDYIDRVGTRDTHSALVGSFADGAFGNNADAFYDYWMFLSDEGADVGLGYLRANTSSAYMTDEWDTFAHSDIFSASGSNPISPISWLLVKDDTDSSSSQIPAPAPLALMALGLLGLGVSRRQSAKR